MTVRLRQIEVSEVIGALPAVLPLTIEDLRGEVFICALGFEARCLEVPRLCAGLGQRFDHAIVCEYDTNIADNAVNRTELLACLSGSSKRVTSISYRDHPRQLQELLYGQTLASGAALRRVVFDISVASNTLLLSTLAELFDADLELVIVYAEAELYRPLKEEYETGRKRWLDRERGGTEHDVSSVGVLQEYPGNHMDLLPDCVMLFPNFKPDRSRAALTFIDPSLLSKSNPKVKWFIGVPHLAEFSWREGAMRTLNELSDTDSTFRVSTFDYRDTLAGLENVFAPIANDYNVTLVPFGSKLQAVASAMFLKRHPQVRVVSATPRDYSSNFSRGCRAKWQISLGTVRELKRLLARAGELRLESQ